MTGEGLCTYADGNMFQGAWAGDVPHGQGQCRFADGSVYRGNIYIYIYICIYICIYGTKVYGQGQCRFADGSVYRGARSRVTVQGLGFRV